MTEIAVGIHSQHTCPSSVAFHVQAFHLFISVGHVSSQWLIVLCSCVCVSRSAGMDSLHFDVSLFCRFKITFKKLPTNKVTKYFWMAQGMIAKLWFTSDAMVEKQPESPIAQHPANASFKSSLLQKAHKQLFPDYKIALVKFAIPDGTLL